MLQVVSTVVGNSRGLIHAPTEVFRGFKFEASRRGKRGDFAFCSRTSCLNAVVVHPLF